VEGSGQESKKSPDGLKNGVLTVNVVIYPYHAELTDFSCFSGCYPLMTLPSTKSTDMALGASLRGLGAVRAKGRVGWISGHLLCHSDAGGWVKRWLFFVCEVLNWPTLPVEAMAWISLFGVF